MSPTDQSRPAPASGFSSGLLFGGILGAVLVWLFGTRSGQKQKAKLKAGGLTLLDELERYLQTNHLPAQAEKELRQLKTAYRQLKSLPARLDDPAASQTAARLTAKSPSPAKKTRSNKLPNKRKFITRKKPS